MRMNSLKVNKIKNMQLDIPLKKMFPPSFVRNPACGGSPTVYFLGVFDNSVICIMVEAFN